MSVPNPPSDFGSSSSSSSDYKEGLACIKARGMLGLGGSVHQPLCIHSLCAGGWLYQLSPYLQQSHLVRLEISPELESLMLYPSNHYTICKPKKNNTSTNTTLSLPLVDSLIILFRSLSSPSICCRKQCHMTRLYVVKRLYLKAEVPGRDFSCRKHSRVCSKVTTTEVPLFIKSYNDSILLPAG